MRCFYHGDVEAVAVCKSCGRGVCHDCASEVGTGTACRNRCETDVEALNAIIERSKSVYHKTSAIYRRNAYFFILLGLVFVGLSFFLGADGQPNLPLLVPTAFFFVAAILQLVNARRFSEK